MLIEFRILDTELTEIVTEFTNDLTAGDLGFCVLWAAKGMLKGVLRHRKAWHVLPQAQQAPFLKVKPRLASNL